MLLSSSGILEMFLTALRLSFPISKMGVAVAPTHRQVVKYNELIGVKHSEQCLAHRNPR